MEQNQICFNKNILVIAVIIVLGAFGFYAWKTNLTLAPYLNNQTSKTDGSDTKDVNTPPLTTDEASWRKQFEEDRK